MSLEIKGLKELNAKLAQLSNISEETMQDELADIALDLASKCSNAAPVDSGDLRGDLASPRRNKEGGTVGWEIGSSLPYTRRQHESIHYNHPRGGGAKFIEKPFRENVNKYIDAIGNAIERNLK